MNMLSGGIVEHLSNPDGPSALVQITEPNGDVYTVRSLCRPDGTTEIGFPSPDIRHYLTERYGPQLSAVVRRTTVGF